MTASATIPGSPAASSLKIENGLVVVPCTLYRGATSKGPVFLASDLPDDPVLRNRLILAALNPDHPGQIDGVGGPETLSNKVAIVSPSRRPDADVDYEFLQFTPGSTSIDDVGNSVNMATSVGPFAIENGLVAASSDETEVRIFAVNSQMNFTARVQSPRGAVTYEGDTAIDGVDGTAAPVKLTYRPPFGNLTGALFPTGNRQDTVDGIPVTAIDAGGTISMILRADAVGRTGHESKMELDADDALAARIEPVRQEVGRLIGLDLDDAAGKSTPGVVMVAPPRGKGSIASRKLATYAGTPAHCHAAYSGSGAVCLAIASVLSGTVAAETVALGQVGRAFDLDIEHPSGVMTLSVDMADPGAEASVAGVSLVRTSRKLFSGRLYAPLQAVREGS